MAKTWIKAKGPFTAHLGGAMVVGHPQHPEARGRFAEVDDGADVTRLIADGHAAKITEEEYRKGIAEDDRPEAGASRLAQLTNEPIKVSPTMSNEFLHAEADKRGIDISAAKNRGEIVKLINGAKVDEPIKPEGVFDNANSRLAGLTADTTSHPQNSSPQAPDPAKQAGFVEGDALATDDDAAPTDGEGEGGGKTDA